MATTSLWHIEGRLKDLITYVENPEKTRADNPNLQPLWDGLPKILREQWGHTLLLETAGQPLTIRPKCRRT